ncbi:MAG: hypothetical protein KBH73_09800 [Syntrophobacterales bacterium]|nr:hypothetical protein [Syntrophobacterales bacterium]
MTTLSRTIAAGLLGVLVTLTPWAAGNPQAAVVLSAREIDLGDLGPGETARARFQIAGTAEGRIRWTLSAPDDWESSRSGLAGETAGPPSMVDITLASLKGRAGAGHHPVEIRITSGRETLVLRRTLAEGPWREALRVESDGGGRTLFLRFNLSDTKARPILEVEPRGIDLGETEPVRETARKIRISNTGAGVLRWQASSGGAGEPPAAGRTRYVSLHNESLPAGAPYAPPPSLKDAVQLTGPWSAEKGYPKAAGPGCALRVQFQGSAAVLTGRGAAENTVLRASVDERPPRELSLEERDGGRFEAVAAENLAEGPHSLQLQATQGAVVLEGLAVRDSRVTAPPSAWMRLAPLSGTTTRETDFVTVRMTLSDLKPGLYTDQVTIASNGGTVRIPVSLSVTGEAAPKHLPVWRYTRGEDVLFTAHPEKEDPRYIGAYRREGLAFRLYGPGTAGTAELYRWYNPSIGDHYYSAERSGGRKNLKGYVFGGAIGNIATIRLPGTRELYRWYHPGTGRHFFTTDPAGEGMGGRGYRFEGTVGFVLR